MSCAADSHAKAQSLLCWLLDGTPFVVRQQATQVLINEVLLDALPAAQSKQKDSGQAALDDSTEGVRTATANHWDILCLHKVPVLKKSCKISKSAYILCLQQSGRHRNRSCTSKWVTSSLVWTACNCLLSVTPNQAAMRSGPNE